MAQASLVVCEQRGSHEPIVDGEGKLDIEGTRWDVLGPNLAKGATVKVTAVEGMKLRVTEA